MIPYIQTAIGALEHVTRELNANANRHDRFGDTNPTYIGASKKRQEYHKAIQFMQLLERELERNRGEHQVQ